MKINGETHSLRRAVDQEVEVLEFYATSTRDKQAVLTFLKKEMKRSGRPQEVITDRLLSYAAAMREIGNDHRQEAGRHLNNRTENCHLPLRRRERATARFRHMCSPHKFVAAHASVHNHFNHDQSLERRTRFQDLRNSALAEWRQLLAA